MPPGTILVVDDSKFARRMADLFLKPLVAAGSRVVHADDGEVALATLRRIDDVGLVLLDLEMPGMSGLEFLVRCRSEARPRALPIVVVSSRSEPELIRQVLDAGADGYVIKPFRPEDFYRVVQGVLDRVADSVNERLCTHETL